MERGLADLALAYDLNRDVWRARAYGRAAELLHRLDAQGCPVVDLRRPALTSGIGPSIAGVIRRLAEGGDDTVRAIVDDVADSREKLEAFRLFRGVLGVGDKAARVLVREGHATLGDLRRAARQRGASPLLLSPAVTHGLRHYADLNARIPRDAARAVIRRLRRHAVGRDAVALGSYRRGLPTVGDIDLLVPPDVSLDGLARRDLPRALGDDLVFLISHGTKRLSFLMRHEARVLRVDLFRMRDTTESVSFLLHGTGGRRFNERMRQAAKARGMRLNEYGLFDLATGRRRELRSEEEAFSALGLAYVPPRCRD